MIPNLPSYQRALLVQIFISLGISAWWMVFGPEWDYHRVFSFIMFLYSLFCGYLFVYYVPNCTQEANKE